MRNNRGAVWGDGSLRGLAFKHVSPHPAPDCSPAQGPSREEPPHESRRSSSSRGGASLLRQSSPYLVRVRAGDDVRDGIGADSRLEPHARMRAKNPERSLSVRRDRSYSRSCGTVIFRPTQIGSKKPGPDVLGIPHISKGQSRGLGAENVRVKERGHIAVTTGFCSVEGALSSLVEAVVRDG